MNPTKSQCIRVGTRKLKPISISKIPAVSSGKYLGAIIAENRLKELEFRRCRQSLYTRYNSLIRHNSSLRRSSDHNKRKVLCAYGVPYSIETLSEVTARITAPHRSMTMHLFPQSYHVKDANNCTIRSRTLYHVISNTQSLPEIHRIRRNNFILQARQSENMLIAGVIGRFKTI